MKKTLIGFGTALVLAAGIVIAFATNAFGLFGHDLRAEITGTGQAKEIALAWPGDFDPEVVGKDTTLSWAATANRKDGVAILIASGVADGTTCRILSDGVEVSTATAKNGTVACTVTIKD